MQGLPNQGDPLDQSDPPNATDPMTTGDPTIEQGATAVPHGPARLVLIVLLPFAGGFFLSHLFRSVNAIIAPRLIAELGLDAADLGLLTAIYFLTFAALQLPLGLLLDRYGPRRVQAVLLLAAALGAVTFAVAGSTLTLMLGRGLIGMGVAGGLMASFKAITLWFPKERWPLVNSCFFATGGLGAMAATTPIEAALTLTDWRGIFLALCIGTLFVAASIFLVVPERGIGTARAGLKQQRADLAAIYRDRLFWRIAPFSVFGQGIYMSLIGLWAGPWFKDVAGFGRGSVADSLFILALSFALGSIAVGLLADALGRLKVSLTSVLAWGGALFLAAQACIVLELMPGSIWPWVAFGVGGNFTMLAYARLSHHFPLELAGRVNTGLNLLVFCCAFLTQYVIGAVIDFWPATSDGRFAPLGYATGFGLFLGLQALAFLWLLLPGRPRRPREDQAS